MTQKQTTFPPSSAWWIDPRTHKWMGLNRVHNVEKVRYSLHKGCSITWNLIWILSARRRLLWASHRVAEDHFNDFAVTSNTNEWLTNQVAGGPWYQVLNYLDMFLTFCVLFLCVLALSLKLFNWYFHQNYRLWFFANKLFVQQVFQYNVAKDSFFNSNSLFKRPQTAFVDEL